MQRLKRAQRFANWLESHAVTPSYSGWLLGSLSIFFFIAATNTMAGWLYVLSSIGVALLGLAAVLPDRVLRGVRVQRHPIAPVSVGDPLTIEVQLENPTLRPKALIQVRDLLPVELGEAAITAIESLAPQSHHVWSYRQPTQRRGIYRWQTLHLRTAAPLGLFWCRRSRQSPARAIVYPTVLPLARCPLIDQMGQDSSLQFNSDRRSQSATEGITRSLRPYRWGDPTRLVHWRTSARYGELRVRELELLTGGQELVICLDTGVWPSSGSIVPSETFEQAVVAAASLYFYAHNHGLNAQLWTASTGTVHGNAAVLETLAAVQADGASEELPVGAIVWLTANPASLSALPPGSRWLLWAAGLEADRSSLELRSSPGLSIDSSQSLVSQLQAETRI